MPDPTPQMELSITFSRIGNATDGFAVYLNGKYPVTPVCPSAGAAEGLFAWALRRMVNKNDFEVRRTL